MPGTLDLVGDAAIYQGDIYEHELTFTDDADTPAALNLSTGTWRAQLRRHPADDDVLASFTIDTTGAATGVLVISLTASQTAALGAALVALLETGRRYQRAVTDVEAYWDLEDTDSGATYLAGRAAVVLEVSR